MFRRTSAPKHSDGLVKYPEQIDCMGAGCPIAAKLGACATGLHHLYYPAASYERVGGIYLQLRNNPHAQISIARCAHDSYHNQYSRADLPRRIAAERFLAESDLLTGLGVHVANLAKTIKTRRKTQRILESDRLSLEDITLYEKRDASMQKWIERHDQALQEDIDVVTGNIQLIPEPIVHAGIATVLVKRDNLLPNIGSFTQTVLTPPSQGVRLVA